MNTPDFLNVEFDAYETAIYFVVFQVETRRNDEKTRRDGAT
jgi:hypothetical protein